MIRSIKQKDGKTSPLFPVVSFCLALAMTPALAADEPATWPKAQVAAFALCNAHFSTPRTTLDSKGRDLMAFSWMTRGRSLFGRFHDLVCDGGYFHAKDAGTWIGMQVAKSGTFTIEVTLTPAEAQPKATVTVLAYADDKAEDMALVQDKTGLALRLGGKQTIELFAPEAGKSVHVLIACDKEKWAAYRDGKPVRSGSLAAGLPAWGTRELVIGAGWSNTDQWHGRAEGIAIFPRALTAEEATAEAAAIKAFQATRKPATTVRFQGTLLRQAKTAALNQIGAYTRSMTAAEYKIDKVLAGEWKQPTITVLHWMIMDYKRLPIADRKPGTAVELTVESYGEQPQLESCRRDDEGFEPDFYCESETAK